MTKTSLNQTRPTKKPNASSEKISNLRENKRTQQILYKATLGFATITRARLNDARSLQAKVLQRQLDNLEQDVVTAYKVGNKTELIECSKELIRLAEIIVSLEPMMLINRNENAA